MSETPPEAPAPEDSGISSTKSGPSGQFAVFHTGLGQYQSGVMSKADAGKALKALKADKDYPFDGGDLVVQEV